MPIFEPYIPKEYLALKINYCKNRLAELPKVTMTQRNVKGIKRTVFVVNNHIYSPDSRTGQQLSFCFQQRETYQSNLSVYEGFWIKGLNYPIYPDFVILIEELNLCKFHEHFGMNNFANYARKTLTKYSNYSEAGLIMDLDVICTYSFEQIPFDLRMLSTKLNHAVYTSLFATPILQS